MKAQEQKGLNINSNATFITYHRRRGDSGNLIELHGCWWWIKWWNGFYVQHLLLQRIQTQELDQSKGLQEGVLTLERGESVSNKRTAHERWEEIGDSWPRFSVFVTGFVSWLQNTCLLFSAKSARFHCWRSWHPCQKVLKELCHAKCRQSSVLEIQDGSSLWTTWHAAFAQNNWKKCHAK